jgi:Ca2+-transporting ATPase
LSAGYARSLGPEQTVEHARSMALAVLIVASATVTAGLSRLRGRAAWVLTATAIGSAVAVLQIPQLAGLLHLEPLHADDWLVALASGLAAGSLSAVFARERRRPGTRAAAR